ncbi:hypothetical protein GOBAR_AA09126 [Gossypium barbadense]|uniref:Uncharacterized protein n=1 Tax=Gossypium barbadense TaxID=3634 RepID=A0A2P5Y7G8_GOSBA|nr:hypothetical protein GOBAR_AA09126 [Gossypium barbadense]
MAVNQTAALKVGFVSNLPGSSTLEVSALLNNVALLMLLRHTFCSQTVNDTCRSLKSYLASVALDYVFIVLPTLLIFTVLAEWVYICMIGLLFLLIFFTAVKRTYSLPYMEGPNASRASISSYRVVTIFSGNLLIFFVTYLCILAVENMLRQRLTGLAWILTLLIDRYVERISRRMCNLTYVTWVVAQNLQNTFIQDGKEMASVLYTYRSCVKALPQAF